MKKNQPGIGIHVVAGSILVLLAATWNVQYHRIQNAKAEAAQGSRSWQEWRMATAEERQAATASIRSQLEAFRQDNYERAALYQSAGLKDAYPSVERFREMIKSTYPQFADHRSVEFGRARANASGDRVAVRTVVTGRDGVEVRALYLMVREGKVYRVEAVRKGGRSHVAPRRHRPNSTINA